MVDSVGSSPTERLPRRDALEVLDFPLVFSQRHLLPRDKFFKEATSRDVLVDQAGLDLLDQHEIIQPMFRSRRSLKGVRSAIRSSAPRDWPRYPPWTFAEDEEGLRADAAAGHLRSGHGSRAIPRGSFSRLIGGTQVQVHEALYSPYQLLDIRDAAELVPLIRSPGRTALWRSRVRAARERSAKAADRAVLLTAIEARYYPRVTGDLTMPARKGFEAWYAEDRKFRARTLLEWSRWSPEEIRAEAERLLHRAWSIDPLRDWIDLIRHVRSSQWKRLRGDALQAVELRIAAEMLIRFHEDLHRVGAAPELPSPRGRSRGSLDDRLKADPSSLDTVLASYGLSPHPAVLLVAEGDTEEVVLPLVMAELGIRRDDAYIKLINARTENRDHSLLVRYASLPRLGPVENGTADFLRPPTRYLIAVDGDQRYRTHSAREAERDGRVDELMRDLPSIYRTAVARDDVRSLVLVEAWTDGLDFERANFSDAQLADAIMATGCAPAGESLATVTAALALQRRSALNGHARNLKAIWTGWPCEPGKPSLALRLWPLLRARIRRKRSRKGLDSIPVARVCLLARDLADGPRANLLLRV